jgi:hypothetical protein
VSILRMLGLHDFKHSFMTTAQSCAKKQLLELEVDAIISFGKNAFSHGWVGFLT